MEKTIIQERLKCLQSRLKEKGIHYYIIPTTDYHQSEYVSDFFKVREYFSGFTGSNGTLVVEQKTAGLWTDGRYFVQAKGELEGTGITLFQMDQKGVPTIAEYIKQNAKVREVVGFDGKILNAEYGEWLKGEFEEIGLSVSYQEDIAGEIWIERPQLLQKPIYLLGQALSGEELTEKIRRLRIELKKKKADLLFLSKLEDIMWLFNIRGNDIEYNPVALSYAVISAKKLLLFLGEEAITDKLQVYAKENEIVLYPYQEAESYLKKIKQKKVLLDKGNVSFFYYGILQKQNQIIAEKNPTELMKAMKNPIEIKNIKEVYRNDSVAVCKFLCWLKNTMKEHSVSELEAAQKMDDFRKQTKNFMDLSFPTISAYGENAAMMHYCVSDEQNAMLKNEGAFLIDSGGQYLGGTTDVTRTVVLGEVSKEFQNDFTAVVSGMLQLQNATFLEGCTGRNLDILARQPLWDNHIDYKCGTGHGIGYMLSVHEGPQGIRWKYSAKVKEEILKPGMIISNEPGVYKEGKYGIRIENILVCVTDTENEDGNFLKFEPLTLVPIDLNGIDRKYLSIENKKRLNLYHEKVYTEISHLLNENEKQWLKEATKELK